MMKTKGPMHNKLGIPESKRVPSGVLKSADHAHDPKAAKQANLADTRQHMARKYGGSCGT